MKISDLIGYSLEEGIKYISGTSNLEVIVNETKGSNKNFKDNLNDCRIIRVSKIDNKVIIITGYF